MAKRVWIAEFSTLYSTAPVSIARLPVLAVQMLDVATSVKQSANFSAQTKYIRIVGEAQFAFRLNATATVATGVLMPANYPEYFLVQPNAFISAIEVI